MKKFTLLLAALIIAGSTGASYAAKQVSASPLVYQGISKYKQKNYTGCIQDMTKIVGTDISKTKTVDLNSSLALYYLGNSYVQIGMKDQAQAAYAAVIVANKDKELVKYSKKAVACMTNAPECGKASPDAPADDMTVFINSGKFMDDKVKNDIQAKILDKQKDKINNNLKPEEANFRYLNDASPAINAQPTNEEIANAVKVLARAGFNPYTAVNTEAMANPQMAQLSAMMGSGNANSNTMNMNNFLPYMTAQGNNQNPQAMQQMMQTMMMSQMVPDFGFSSNDNAPNL